MPLRTVRLVVSGAVLLALGAGFIFPEAARDLTAALAGLQLAPAVLRMASAWTLGGAWLTAGLIVALNMLAAFLFGRVYCSSLCPLGTCQDLAAPVGRLLRRRIFPGRPNAGFRKEGRLVRLGAFGAVAVSAALGVPLLLNLVEPWSFFGRFIHDAVLPAFALGSDLLGRLLKPFGIYTAPLEFAVEPALVLLTAVSTVLLLVLVARRGRLFCDSLCPTGTLLRLAAARPVLSLIVSEAACTNCGQCGRVCPVGCILPGPRIDQGRCVRCFDCLTACPARAIRFGSRSFPANATGSRTARTGKIETQAPASGPSSPSRRSFLSTCAFGLPALAGLAGLQPLLAAPGGDVSDRPAPPAPPPSSGPEPVLPSAGVRPDVPPYSSPPGSWSIERFNSICTACHLCVSVCPTRVLKPLASAYGPRGFMQPAMDYRSGFCEYPCKRCSEVCPTGAIAPISLRRKQTTRIGIARLYRDMCVVFERGTACGACAEVCPTHAVHMIAWKPGLTAPETDYSLCIGCGSCQFACPVAMDGHGRLWLSHRPPVAVLKPIMVEPVALHVQVDDRKNDDGRPRSTPVQPPASAPAADGPAATSPQPVIRPNAAKKNEDFPF